MIIDFHVHGKIRNSFAFDAEQFLLTVNEARKNGLDSLAVTEHCHSTDFLEGYEFLNSNYNRIGDYFDVDGFKVFYGMEVATDEWLDILIIGNPDLVIELRNNINNSLNGREYLEIKELFSLSLPDELLIILAHPYRKHTDLPSLGNKVFDRLDAVEFNARDLQEQGIESMKEKISELANKFDLPIVCGSDTHHFIQISSIKNVFDKNCNAVTEIKKEIKLGKYKVEISPELDIRIRSEKIIKKLICNS